MRYDCVIVGAGLAGATSARLLAEVGFSVIVVEAKRHIAGQCYDYKELQSINMAHIYFILGRRKYGILSIVFLIFLIINIGFKAIQKGNIINFQSTETLLILYSV